MRTLAFLLLATLALAPPCVSARPAPAHALVAMPASAPASASAAPATPRLVEDGHYRNVDGVVVHTPAHTDTGASPQGASAQCRDGTYSFSLHRRGTCSHHGGVATWR